MQWRSGIYEYIIDFSRMVQINLNTNKERKIRRRPEKFVNPNMIDQQRNRCVNIDIQGFNKLIDYC